MRHYYQKLVLLFSALALCENATRAGPQDATAVAHSSFQPRDVSTADLKPRREWRNVGRSTPQTCFETLCWAQVTGDLDVLANSILIEDPARLRAQEAFAALSPDEQRQLVSADRFVAKLLSLRNPMAGVRVLGVEPNPNRADEVMLHWINGYDDGRIRENKNILLRSTPDGWRQKITLRLVDPLLRFGINRAPGPVTGSAVVPQMNPAASPVRLSPGLVPTQDLLNRGNATALAAFETIQWARVQRDFATLEQLIVIKPEARKKAEARLASLSADGRARMPEVTSPERLVIADWIAGNNEAGLQVHTQTALAVDRIYLSGVRQDIRGVSNFDSVFRRTESGWKWLMGDNVFTSTLNAGVAR
jgi:hypothetical protein